MSTTRVAAKQLTASDLSFFAKHLRRSKQKGINLNSDVFVDIFYPSLAGRTDELPFPLAIVGPGPRPPHILTRKALRTPGAKNWRLDGEIVNDPADDAGRFDALQPNDVAFLAFAGAERPESVTLVLVSASEDPELHAAVSEAFRFEGRETMVPVSADVLAGLIDRTASKYEGQHPLDHIRSPDSVAEAMFGPAVAQAMVASTDGRGARITRDGLRRQLQNADETGFKGEELFDRWLASTGHQEDDYEWVTLTHARATHDFFVARPRWPGGLGQSFVDVKATKGSLAGSVHMSMAEIRWAAAHASYRIARVVGVESDNPKVTLFAGVHEVSKGIMETVVAALPPGTSIDSLEIETNRFAEELTDLVPPLVG